MIILAIGIPVVALSILALSTYISNKMATKIEVEPLKKDW